MDSYLEDEQQTLALAQQQAVLKEWMYLQQSLLYFASATSLSQLHFQRALFEGHVAQITAHRARSCWKETGSRRDAKGARYVEMCHQQHRYGLLELAADYLVTSLLPGLPQLFADLCALLLYTAEHEGFARAQFTQLPPSTARRCRKALTKREKDVLHGLMCGEAEHDMASRLGIVRATVHSHLQRLYSRLEVNCAQEAIARAFELRLVDWLDLPLSKPGLAPGE